MRWIVMSQTAVGAVLLLAGVAKIVGRTSVRMFLDAVGFPPL